MNLEEFVGTLKTKNLYIWPWWISHDNTNRTWATHSVFDGPKIDYHAPFLLDERDDCPQCGSAVPAFTKLAAKLGA